MKTLVEQTDSDWFSKTPVNGHKLYWVHKDRSQPQEDYSLKYDTQEARLGTAKDSAKGLWEGGGLHGRDGFWYERKGEYYIGILVGSKGNCQLTEEAFSWLRVLEIEANGAQA